MKKTIFSIAFMLFAAVALWAQPNPGNNSGGGSVGGGPIGGPTTKNLSIRIFLEGPYNGTNMNTDLLSNNILPTSQPYNTAPWYYSGTESVVAFPPYIVDWVLVELRDANAPENALPATKLSGWPKAFFLRNDGYIVDLNGNLPDIGNPTITNNLFIVVRHRNHLDVLSNTGATLSGNTYSYDFSTGINQAYGGSAGYKQLSGSVYGMVSADSDADGSLTVGDFNNWSVDFGSSNVYLSTDADLNGSTQVSDFNFWSQNFGLNHPVNAPNSGGVGIYKSQVPDKQ